MSPNVKNAIIGEILSYYNQQTKEEVAKHWGSVLDNIAKNHEVKCGEALCEHAICAAPSDTCQDQRY